MRIVAVEPLVMGTPWRNLTIVRVTTDEGLEGLGEVRMVNHTQALLGYLAYAIPTHIVGTDPFRVEDLIQRMIHADFERSGSVSMSGLAAIEIACWDIMGKALGRPVYELLGGAVREKIKAYANGWYTVERTPEDMFQAAQRVTARGYRALKLDPFGPGMYELERAERLRAIDIVEAVRSAVGDDVEILVEMHGRFTPAVAIAISRDLERFEPSWVEEPVPPDNLKALSKVAHAVKIPVATGERIHVRHEFRELFELQAADIVQPDITSVGGLLETRRIASWAETYFTMIAPHNVGGPVSTAAALHLGACTPNFKILEHFNDFADSEIKASALGNPEVVDGWFELPRGPGLGVVLDRAVVEAHPPQTVHFDLYAKDWHLRRARVVETGA